MAPFSRSPDGGPSLRLALPRLNRDLIAVIAIIGFVTAGLGLVYGVSVLQFLINGFVVGSIYILGATGLSLIFGIRKFANFSHGEMMAFGAYMAWIVNTIWLLDILVGLILAVVATALLGMTLELLVFRKLADKGPVSALVASIGITIFLQNFIAAIFGTSVQAYNLRVAVNYVLLADNNGVAVLSINPIKGVATLVLASVLILFLHFT